jgi:hypothetical protein
LTWRSLPRVSNVASRYLSGQLADGHELLNKINTQTQTDTRKEQSEIAEALSRAEYFGAPGVAIIPGPNFQFEYVDDHPAARQYRFQRLGMDMIFAEQGGLLGPSANYLALAKRSA